MGSLGSTQRHRGVDLDDEAAPTAAIVRLAARFGRYGCWRITPLLQAERWTVNHKRVERIWQQEGLKVPRRQPKRRRLWLTEGSCLRLRPMHRNHVWAYDLMAARAHDGRPLRLLTVVDAYTGQCLAIKVSRYLRADDVLHCLKELYVAHGVPAGSVRSQTTRPLRASRQSENRQGYARELSARRLRSDRPAGTAKLSWLPHVRLSRVPQDLQ